MGKVANLAKRADGLGRTFPGAAELPALSARPGKRTDRRRAAREIPARRDEAAKRRAQSPLPGKARARRSLIAATSPRAPPLLATLRFATNVNIPN